ncbi:sulfatase-like hydrolase/transferase [Pirellulaceae bacterium]|nr:sulfatase-like hydrolase/transferase [Pirellulaceae bacterium]
MQRLLSAFALWILTVNSPLAFSQNQSIPVDLINLPEGFRIELLHSVAANEGSWVSLTHDPQGRLITSDQYGGLFRITPPAIGSKDAPKIEKLAVEMGHAQGLLYAFDSLYAVVNGKPFGKGPGLYRLRDTNNDDQFDEVSLLRSIEGGGEHGPHAVILSPNKKSLYVCGGNHTKIPNPEKSRVPRNWAEDQILPRMWDAGGHAVGKLAPGGWICKTDPDGKEWELISSGYRNEYDIAFNPEGDLFTYDADMEWDIGSPWYRPTRVCFAPSGSEFGWRSGTGKWPAYYPDNLPATVDIGPGCPTGVAFGTGAKFPAKYQRSLFICDWSYGIIYAVDMQQDGGGYKGVAERFCSAPALQGTDISIGPDGAMYFTIGGRRTQSGLYRVTYTGNESTDPIKRQPLNKVAKLRREIEKFHKKAGPQAIKIAMQHLGHSDRFVRYAARIALEHQPVKQWGPSVLSQTDPLALINGIVAFARNAASNRANRMAAVTALSNLDPNKLNESQTLELIRAYGLALIRLGREAGGGEDKVVEKLNGLFPSKSDSINLELARILIAVEAPGIVDRVVKQLQESPSQEEQIHYALCLRNAAKGWKAATRTDYFQWFLKAAVLQGGHSFTGFLKNIRDEAVAKMSDAEKEQFKDLLAKKPTTTDPYANLKARPFVKKWKLDDLLEDVNTKLEGRDLANGKKMFGIAQCYKCHRFDRQGGIVGPDLTGLGRRYNNRDLLESLINPSKTVSDQYQATMFQLDNGQVITGRVANLAGKNYRVITDMMKPGNFTNVNVDHLEAMKPAKNSMMPDGLMDNLTKDEILDLVAYLKSSSEKQISINKSNISVKKKGVIEPAEIGKSPVSRSVPRTAPAASAKTNAVAKPNVLFIISDDQTWTDYGFMDHPVIQTPNLDQLAQESVTFTRGYVPTSLCRPSLMTMISGLYPRQHLITGNDPGVPDGQNRRTTMASAAYKSLRKELIANVDRVPTLPRWLAEKGYNSFQCGKWWEGHYSRGGFTHGMTHGDPKRGGRHGDEGLKIGRTGLGPIRQFLDENKEEPFFMWYAPFLPHSPHNPPARLLEKYRSKVKHLSTAKYYAMCEWFDETCGELLDELDKRQLAENTIVYYITDNGWIQRNPETPLPQGWRTSFAPKSKQSPFDGGLRTPVMIRWPKKIKPKMDTQTLVSSIDMVPTILSAAGIDLPENLPGENLLPYCLGEAKSLSRSSLMGEIYAHDIADLKDPSKSLLYEWCIDGYDKIIETHPGKIGAYRIVHSVVPQGPLFFDLKSDPLEEQPLTEGPAKLKKALKECRDQIK